MVRVGVLGLHPFAFVCACAPDEDMASSAMDMVWFFGAVDAA